MKLHKETKLTGKNSRLVDTIVRFSFKLEKSYRYNAIKNLFYNLLDNPNSKSRIVFDVIMIFLILFSIVLLIYSVKHLESKMFSEFSRSFELFIVIIFICEYSLRFWVYNHNHQLIIEQYEHSELTGEPITFWLITKLLIARKWKYISSPFAVIDLLAILPSYRPLRFLRLFLLFRLFKLFRYTRIINSFANVLLERRFEFFTLAIFLCFLVFASSTAIYYFEGNGINPHINNYFDAIYWALVTISTVGFGDITPVSIEGRFVTLVLIISGMGVLAFSTSIVVAAFTEKLGELKKNQVYAEIERLKDYVIICGYGRVGETVAKLLRAENANVLVVDNDETRTTKARLVDGFLAITGDAGDSQLLQSIEKRKHSPIVLCLTGSDVTNVYITLTVKKLYKNVTVISRANRQDTTKKLELAGADQVITPYKVVGLVAFESIGKQVAFEAIYGMLTEHKYFSIDTIPFQVASKVEQIVLQDIDFKQFKLTLLGMITEESEDIPKNGTFPLVKRKFIFNPNQSIIFSAGKMLVVFGHKYSVKNFRNKLATAKVINGQLVI